MLLSITPLLMFILLFILILMGIPVAFSLLFTALIFALVLQGWTGLDLLFQAFWATMNNSTLTAVPLFIFMSALLEKSGIVDDMYRALRNLVGGVQGSLLIVTLIMGYIIGAMSSVAAAGVVSLALIMYPILQKAYPKAEDLAIGVTVFSGTLPQLIPPSLNMIVYSSMTGVSVIKLFAGGLVMGTLLTAVAVAYVVLYSFINRDKIPKLVIKVSARERLNSVVGLIPPLIVILSVLGSILIGIATPTEASGIGAFAIFLYTLLTKRLSKKVLKDSLLTTAKLSAMVGWIVSGALAFGSVFSISGGYSILTSISLSIPKTAAPVILVLLIFFLGMFLETVSITTIIGPLSDYIIRSLGLDSLWWGNIFCFTLMTAFLTPPVGMGVYLFKGVVQDISMSKIFKSTIPFLIIELILIGIFLAFPGTILIPLKTFT